MSEYLRRLVLAQQKGLIDKGTAALANVFHDDYCAHLRNKGPCDCDPDIIVRSDKGSMAIDKDGNWKVKS